MFKSILATTIFLIMLAGFTFSEELASDPTETLKTRADEVLKMPNVCARSEIDVVFQYVDKLVMEGEDEMAERYLVRALQHAPWRLEYQMLHAELLDRADRRETAADRARLVLNKAETDELIVRARKLLGKEALSEFESDVELPENGYCLVLVPIMEYDRWLVLRLKEKLTEKLSIPVHIRKITAEYPPPDRDRRQTVLEQLRKVLTQSTDDLAVSFAMSRLGLTEEDLDDDDNVIKLMEILLVSMQQEEAADRLRSNLEAAGGKDQQWDAGKLLPVLEEAAEPYRRRGAAFVGITSADIYARDYRFLFGWARRSFGVMSYRRFSSFFTGETPNQDRLFERALKQALSSSGLVFGIQRCTYPTCARAYPHSLSEHDAKKPLLCSECKSGFRDLFDKDNAAEKNG